MSQSESEMRKSASCSRNGAVKTLCRLENKMLECGSKRRAAEQPGVPIFPAACRDTQGNQSKDTVGMLV